MRHTIVAVAAATAIVLFGVVGPANATEPSGASGNPSVSSGGVPGTEVVHGEPTFNYQNSCDTTTLVGVAAAGGSASTVAGIIFSETGVGIAVIVVGALMGVLAGRATASNNRNQGIEIHLPYVGPAYITSQ